MQLPQVNAQLLSVRRRVDTENYTAAERTKSVWTGGADAYVMRKQRTNLNEQGQLNRMEEVTIIIPSDLTPQVNVQDGDEVTFSQWDPITPGDTTEFSARAQLIVTPSNLPGVPQYMKIGLEKVIVKPA